MRYTAMILILAGLSALAALWPAALLQNEPGTGTGDDLKESSSGHRFPDFGFMPPASQYEGRVFKLSQDYPEKVPDPAQAPVICTKDFEEIKKNWKKYLLDIRDYCFKGNVLDGDVEDDWRVENNLENRWFHMPWQHYGPKGREGIHGLTKEAPVQARQLAWSQTYSEGQTYAVGFYNEYGGYTIGQVWKDHKRPDLKMKIEFPVGTIVCKVLFVDVPPDQVPSLIHPLQWQGYITKNFQSVDRSIRDLSLIQMDIMVRHRSAPFGWLFGTYQYNGARNMKNRWENLVPVGLQWGNDPSIRDDASNPHPVKTVINKKLKETVINADAQELPPTHLGWNGRLNGPVDNPMSSCMSCHMTAATPQLRQNSPLFENNPPAPGSKLWMPWFDNLPCGEKFDKKTSPTDYSLQMAMALQNFRSWSNEGSKLKAERYKKSERKVRAQIKDPKAPTPHEIIMHDADLPEEVEIRRDFPH
jgi:hypothetical protein